MNKTTLTTLLQVVMFLNDGATEQEIMNLNPDYSVKLVKTGNKLFEFLQEKIQ